MGAGKPQRRPNGWGPQWFLAFLVQHPGEQLRDIYAGWAQEWGARQDLIVRDVRAWKQSEPGFEAALNALKGRTRAGAPKRDETDPEWRERFLDAYRRTHNRKRAAEEVGLEWGYIRRLFQPSSPVYDAMLVEAAKEIEDETRELARGGIKSALEIAEEMGDARTLGKLSLDVLERRAPEEWSRHQVIQQAGTIFHVSIEGRRDALQRALVTSQNAVAALPAAPNAIPAVIEGELVKEEA